MPLEFPYKEIGSRIRTRRTKLNKTQDEVAKLIGLTRSSLANIEGGNQRILVHQLYALSEVLDMEVNSLVPAKPTENDHDVEEINLGDDIDPKFASDIKKIISG